MWEKRNAYRIPVGKPTERGHLEVESIILKCIASR
jgi:hypothetical protein